MGVRELGNPLGNPLAIRSGVKSSQQVSITPRYPKLILLKYPNAPYIATNYLQPGLGWTYPSVALSSDPFTGRPWTHPSGEKLFANTSGGITEFSIPDCIALRTNSSLTSIIIGISNSGDSLVLADGSIISTVDLQIIGTLSGASGKIGPVAFSPDDSILATVYGVSSNLTVRFYSTVSMAVIAETAVLTTNPYTSVNTSSYIYTPVFNPDATKVAVAIPIGTSGVETGYLINVSTASVIKSMYGIDTAGRNAYAMPFFYDRSNGWGMVKRALVTDSFVSNQDNSANQLGICIGNITAGDLVELSGDFLICRLGTSGVIQMYDLTAIPGNRFINTAVASGVPAFGTIYTEVVK